MKRYIDVENRSQSTLFPESLNDYIADDNAVQAVDTFVNKLDLKLRGFDRAEPTCEQKLLFSHSLSIMRYLLVPTQKAPSYKSDSERRYTE